MSVRDKIASFGGAGSSSSSSSSNGFASTARIGTNIPPSSSNARAFPHETTTYSGATGAGDAVRKLNVPSVFKNATKPADVPAPAATAQPSVSGAAKKWGAPATKAGAPSGAASGGSNSSAVVAGFSAGNGPASRWGPPAHGYQNGAAAPSTAKRAGVSKGERKPRDILGVGLGSSSSSSSYMPAAATASKAGVESTARTGGGSGNLSSGSSERGSAGRASPSSRSNKPKAGPRKLNLTRISAEKQRAALCLDKVVDDEADGSSGGEKRPGIGGSSISASKPGGATGSGARTGSGGVSSSSSSSYAKPAPTAARATASGRAVGSTAARSSGSGSASKLPSASSLRSSGHNLW